MSGLVTDNIFTNKAAWRKAQCENQACSFAKHLLKTGKPPPKATGKTAGEYYNEVRFYCRESTLTPDGLLVHRTSPSAMSGNIRRDRIIIPKPLASALLWHLHNHYETHPTKSQQKITFQRSFHAMDLEKHLDNLYKTCYKCQVLHRLPKDLTQQETKSVSTLMSSREPGKLS